MPIPKSTKRSGGPRSQAGKARSAFNAVKSGAYATHALLPGDDPAQFAQLEAQLLESFCPADLIEAALVHELTLLAWKKQRLAATEQTLLSHRLRAPVTFEEEQRLKRVWPAYAQRALPYLDDIDGETVAYSRKLKHQAEYLQKQQLTEAALIQAQQQMPELYRALIDTAERWLGSITPTPKELLRQTIVHEDGSSDGLLEAALNDIILHASAMIWAYPRCATLRQDWATIRAQRVIDWFEQASWQRARDDLSRAFFRTLAELRDQQTWRRRQRAIDVTPTADEAEDAEFADTATIDPPAAAVDGEIDDLPDHWGD